MIDQSARSRCIESLGYVRYLVEGRLDSGECPQHGHYSPLSGVCQQCSEQYECEWLFKTDPMADFEHKSDAALAKALEFAVHYISGQTTAVGHDQAECQCESCVWLRKNELELKRMQR